MRTKPVPMSAQLAFLRALEYLEEALGWTPSLYRSNPVAERIERAVCAATPDPRYPNYCHKLQRCMIEDSLRFLRSEARLLPELGSQDSIRQIRLLRLLSLGWSPENRTEKPFGISEPVYSAPWDRRREFVQTLAQAIESQAWVDRTGIERYPTIRELEGT